MFNVQRRLLAAHGADNTWGRGLHRRFRSHGLADAGMEGRLTVWQGGSVGTRLYQANFRQIRAESVDAGLITDAEVEGMLALLDDPDLIVNSPIMMSAWGRKPR